MSFKVNLYGGTDVGRQRGHNEDSFSIIYNVNNKWIEASGIEKDISHTKGVLAVVADGMGGANAGEVASEIAIRTVLENAKSIDQLFSNEIEYGNFLISVIKKAHKNIVAKAKQNKELRGMGTTIVLIWIVQEYLYVAWCGDSRCYFYNKNRDNKLDPFTDDHSLVWTRVKSGEISPEEARLSSDSNLIIQSLGDNNQNPNPDFIWTKLGDNDRILLCSDGLNSMLSDVGIQQILDYNSSAKDSCTSLIKAANNAGGADNITVILADILSTDSISPLVTIDGIKKKNVYGKWIIVIILLLVIGIFFHKNIQSVYENFKKLYSSQHVIDSMQYENIRDDVFKDTLENIPIHNIATTDVSKDTKLKNANEKHPIDTVLIKAELTKALITIDKLQKKLKLSESNFDSTYYTKNKEKLLSFYNRLDSISDEIKNVAKVNVNNVIAITDFEKAPKIYKPIKILIDDISMEIKSIAEMKTSNFKPPNDSTNNIIKEDTTVNKNSIDISH